MKLHVLRGELTVLLEDILSHNTMDGKEDTITSYEMQFPLDAFVTFFLDWAQTHLQVTLEHADWPLSGKAYVKTASRIQRKIPFPVRRTPSQRSKSPTPTKRTKRARVSKDVASPTARQPTRVSKRTRNAKHTFELSDSEMDDGEATEEQVGLDDSEAEQPRARTRTVVRRRNRKAALPPVEEANDLGDEPTNTTALAQPTRTERGQERREEQAEAQMEEAHGEAGEGAEKDEEEPMEPS